MAKLKINSKSPTKLIIKELATNKLVRKIIWNDSVIYERTFNDDDWETIAKNIRSGNDPYKLGDEKIDTITIGGTSYQVTFKIVDDLVGRYSTAIGQSHKVIEMQTIIGPTKWTDNDDTPFNSSALKTWMNSTEVILYFPPLLRQYLSNTEVYSGPGNAATTDANKVKSTCRLFPACFTEYYGTDSSYNFANNYETNSKGQFTWYQQQGVTTSNFTGLKKKTLNGSYEQYWTRSPFSRDSDVAVLSNGSKYAFVTGYSVYVCVCFAW